MFRSNYCMPMKQSFMGKGLMTSSLKPKQKQEEMEQLSANVPVSHYYKPSFQPIMPDNKGRNLSNVAMDQTNLLNNSVPLSTVLTDLTFRKKKKNTQQGTGVKLNIY